MWAGPNKHKILRLVGQGHTLRLACDAGGTDHAAATVETRFGPALGAIATALDDLRDNFTDHESQGSNAYADEMIRNQPSLDHSTL